MILQYKLCLNRSVFVFDSNSEGGGKKRQKLLSKRWLPHNDVIQKLCEWVWMCVFSLRIMFASGFSADASEIWKLAISFMLKRHSPIFYTHTHTSYPPLHHSLWFQYYWYIVRAESLLIIKMKWYFYKATNYHYEICNSNLINLFFCVNGFKN